MRYDIIRTGDTGIGPCSTGSVGGCDVIVPAVDGRFASVAEARRACRRADEEAFEQFLRQCPDAGALPPWTE